MSNGEDSILSLRIPSLSFGSLVTGTSAVRTEGSNEVSLEPDIVGDFIEQELGNLLDNYYFFVYYYQLEFVSIVY